MRVEQSTEGISESLVTLKKLLRAQAEHLLMVEQERDLFMAGYKAAVKKCNDLEVALNQKIDENITLRK